MKTLVLVASVVGAIASPAFAAYDRYGNYYDDSRTYYDSRDSDRYGNYYDGSRTYYDSRDSYRRGDAARVIESQPVYAAAGTRQECWNSREGRYQAPGESSDSNRVAGTALGAIVGGVIGHQLGSGRGNDAATVGGAILGGIAGNQIQRQQQDRNDDLDMSRCRTVASGDNTLQGYDVRYEYRGQQYVTRMASEPGRFLTLGSDIRDDGTPFDSSVAYSTPSYSTPSYSSPSYSSPYSYNNNPYGGGG